MIEQQLSFKNPLIQITVATVILVVFTVIASQKLILAPHKDEISELKKNVQHIKLEDAIGNLYDDVNSSETLLAPQKDPNWLRIKISDIAASIDLNLASIHPLSVKKVPPYQYVPFKVKTTCSYQTLIKFINALESNPYLIAIESIKIDNKTTYKKEILEEELPKEYKAETEIVIGTVY